MRRLAEAIRNLQPLVSSYQNYNTANSDELTMTRSASGRSASAMHSSSSWLPRRNTHLLRLWAEVFTVRHMPPPPRDQHEDDDSDYCWQRLSDDVIPVNVLCLQEHPDFIYQILAHDRCGVCVIDARVIQPGTRIYQPSECFVHFHDISTNGEWGLNFTSPVDAKRFRVCCSAGESMSRRKASSASSLRSSPGGRDADTNSGVTFSPTATELRKSEPCSPHNEMRPRRTISSPEQLAESNSNTLVSGRPATRQQRPAVYSTYAGDQYSRYKAYQEQDNVYGKIQNVASDDSPVQALVDDNRYVELRVGNVRHKHRTRASVHQEAHEGDYCTCGLLARIRVPPDTNERPERTSGPRSIMRHSQTCIDNQEVQTHYGSNCSLKRRSASQPRTQLTSILRQSATRVELASVGQSGPSSADFSTVKCSLPLTCDTEHRGLHVAPNVALGVVRAGQSKHRADSDSGCAATTTELSSGSSNATQCNANSQELCAAQKPRRLQGSLSFVVDQADRYNAVYSADSPATVYMVSASGRPPDEATTADCVQPRGYVKTQVAELSYEAANWSEPPCTNTNTNANANANANANEAGLHNNASRSQGSCENGRMRKFVFGSFTDLSRIDEHSENTASKAHAAGNRVHGHESFVFVSLQDGAAKKSVDVGVGTGAGAGAGAIFNTDLDAVEIKDGATMLNERANAEPTISTCTNSPTISSSVCISSDSEDGQATLNRAFDKVPETVSVSVKNGMSTTVASANAAALVRAETQQSALELQVRQHRAMSNLTALNMNSIESVRTCNVASRSDDNVQVRCASPRRCPTAAAKPRRKLRKTFERQISQRIDSTDLPFFEQDSDTPTPHNLYDAEDEDAAACGAAQNNDEDSESSISTMTQNELTNVSVLSTHLTGAIRKSGWLFAKKWLMHRQTAVEFARTRTWKKYWVVLKGGALLFYSNACATVDRNSIPNHVILIDGAVALALSELQKRENVFALATAFGEAYLFQAADSDNLCEWIDTIHAAAASQFARQLGSESVANLLKSELKRLESHIDLDNKMKKMNEMQLNVANETEEEKRAITKQICTWEDNIERMTLETIRCSCYLLALQRWPAAKQHLSMIANLPNCDDKQATTLLYPRSDKLAASYRTLLSVCSKHSCTLLEKMGTFNLIGLYTLVSAKAPLTTTVLKKRTRSAMNANTQLQNRKRLSVAMFEANENGRSDQQALVVHLPNGTRSNMSIRHGMTVRDVFETSCIQNDLSPSEHFMRLSLLNQGIDLIPDASALFEQAEFQQVEVCRKVLFCCRLGMQPNDTELPNETTSNVILRRFGVRLVGELQFEHAIANGNTHDEAKISEQLVLQVQHVLRGSAAEELGLVIGDEILRVNDTSVADLDMVFMEQLIAAANSLSLVVRSCRNNVPPNCSRISPTDYALSLLTLGSDSASFLPDASRQHSLTPLSPPLVTSTDDDEGGRTVTASPRYPLPHRKSSGALRATHTISNRVSSGESEMMREHCRHADKVTPAQCSLCSSRFTAAEYGGYACSKVAGRIESQNSVAGAFHNASSALSVLVDDSKADGSTKSTSSNSSSSSSKLSNVDKIRKCTAELIDTEQIYVKDLRYLLEVYVRPLRYEVFWQSSDLQQLHETLCEMLRFQEQFLSAMQSIRESHPLDSVQTTEHLRVVLSSVADIFLRSAERFKIYGSFTAAHSRVLGFFSDERGRLRQFLQNSARSSTQVQHSHVLESYLIKPVQRIVKYPLLLKQLGKLCSESCINVPSLSKALFCMESVAEHINEMQKIHEDFGEIFEEMLKFYAGNALRNDGGAAVAFLQQRIPDLNLSELQMYGTIEWLNMADYCPLPLSRKKQSDLISTYCFVFRSGVVLLCMEKQRTKSKQSLKSSSSSSLQLDRKTAGGNRKQSMTRTVRYHTWIPAEELEVRTNGNTMSQLVHDTECCYHWQLVHLRPLVSGLHSSVTPPALSCRSPFSHLSTLPNSNSQVCNQKELYYLLVNCSSNARSDFLRIIRYVIRDAVRKLNVPSRATNTTYSAAPERHSMLLSANDHNADSGSPICFSNSADDTTVNYQPAADSRYSAQSVILCMPPAMKAGSRVAAQLANEPMQARCASIFTTDKRRFFYERSDTVPKSGYDKSQNADQANRKSTKLALAPPGHPPCGTDKRSPVWQPRSKVTYDVSQFSKKRYAEQGGTSAAYSIDYSPYAVGEQATYFNVSEDDSEGNSHNLTAHAHQVAGSQSSAESAEKCEALDYAVTSHV